MNLEGQAQVATAREYRQLGDALSILVLRELFALEENLECRP